MKYGETLRQRSVPQWAYQNVAYDSIKQLIKEHTTPGKGKAVTIPGQGDTVEDTFEDQLFILFSEQHDNVNLFVRSKSGEIDRRLDHLSRQLHNIQLASWPPSVIPTRIPPSRLAKYGRLEEQALQAGEEIKLLSRFITVQKTAFIKLLKKYRKWTGRTWLDARWNTEIVASEDSFTNFDLGPFFEHWADSLQEIRYAMGVGQARSGLTSASQSPAINPMAPKQSSLTVSRSINEALSVASDVDFDAILAAAPLGSDGSRAIYWVHPEQLVELQVLLLQHTRLAFPKSSSPGSTSASDTPTITRRSSLSTPRRDSFFERELSSGIVVFDDPEEFALLQNTLPIADSENSHLRSPTEAAMTTRWSNGGDLLLSLRHKPDNEASNTVPSSARLKTKHFASFLDFERNFVPRLSSELDLSNSTTSHNQDQLSAARKWLSENRKVQPLVGIFSRRSRFVNLTSGKDCGQWCVLDIDISLKKVGFGDLEGKEWPLNITHDATKFPFAVLEVRQEGKANVDLIKLLDESYLTERVRGFSLSAHALWTCRRPHKMTPPFWLPVLSGDIRKLPSQNIARRLRKNGAKPPRSSSSVDVEDVGSSSTAVSTGGESPFEPFLLPSSKGRPVKNSSAVVAARRKEMSQVANTRYWSEYDHPEDEGSEEGGYYIYIDPDAEGDEVWIPFKNTFTSIYNRIRQLVKGDDNEPQAILDPINEPLLPPRVSKDRFFETVNDDYNTSSSSAASSSSDDDDNDILNPRIRYGTLPALEAASAFSTHGDNNAIGLLLASIISLFFSATLSVVLLVLTAVGRKRARGEVDLVVLAGTVISLTFGIAGLCGMVRGHASIMRWVIGLSVFCGVLIIDALQFGMLFKNVLAAIPSPS